MKILIVIPPPASPDHPLLGVASLAASIQRAGHEVQVLDLNAACFRSGLLSSSAWIKEGFESWNSPLTRSERWEAIGNTCKNLIAVASRGGDWSVIGFHVNSGSKWIAAKLAILCREVMPGPKLVAGGPEFFIGDELKGKGCYPYDAVFVGEANVSFPDWLYASFDARVPGVLSSDGFYPGIPVTMDKLPSPDFDLFPLSDYSRSSVLPAETSRGCINDCLFCDDVRMWGRQRLRGLTKVADELSMLEKKASHISFSDSLLNPNMDRFRLLLRILKNHRLTWDGMLQARTIDPRIALDVANSGCTDVFIGCESFVVSYLRKLGKSGPSSHARDTVKWLADAGVGVSIGLIVAGPPFQTRDEFLSDMEILAGISTRLKSAAVNPLCIPRGTRLWHRANQMEIRGLETESGWRFWHAGGGLSDIEVRLTWCKELADHLNSLGVSIGANYENFESFVSAQIDDARWAMRSDQNRLGY